MDCNYDEDLSENVFFQALQMDHSDLLLKSTSQGCVICVPRAGSLPKYALSVDDFYTHILIPSQELPESHYHTLNDKQVKIINRVLTVESSDITQPLSVHVLFEETYYTQDYSYKVLCIEGPLEQKHDGLDSCSSSFVVLKTLRDCIDLLWIESSRKDILERLDNLINTYELQQQCSLQVIKDVTGSFYSKCLQLVLKDVRLREKTNIDKHFLDLIKVAVESYMHHGIYKKLIKNVSDCMLHDDSCLNKMVRNLSDLQSRDLLIPSDFNNVLPKAKLELSKIDGFGTVLGKISCLKKMLDAITKHPITGNIMAADDLLPIVVFLVLKTNLPNWYTHLCYLKHFRFSTCNYQDEFWFLVTSLEAALEHIRSGCLLGSADPEGQSTELLVDNTETNLGQLKTETITNLFKQIKLGNVDEVEHILHNKQTTFDYNHYSQLCHPLCVCDKCERLLTKQLRETNPTVLSCDDRGLTALHVASIYGCPKIIDLLLSLKAEANSSDCNGATPCHYAAMKGHQNVLLLLLHHGADLNCCDNLLNTPLHLCVNNGHEDCVKALIYFSEHSDVKLNINLQNTNGDTALHHAAHWGYHNIVSLLIQNCADPYVSNKRKLTAFDCAYSTQIMTALKQTNFVQRPNLIRIKQFVNSPSLDLCEDETQKANVLQGIKPDTTENIRKVDKLLRAITYNDVNLACFYLGINTRQKVENKSVESETCKEFKYICHPLCDCNNCKPVSNVEVTIHNYLNVNVCNSDGYTPLHVAAMHGQAQLTNILISNGALLDVQTRKKLLTPLMLACQGQRVQIVKILLINNCNIDLQDSKGNTALHYTCFCNNKLLVETLCKFDPNFSLQNYNNKTALQEAEEKIYLGVLKILKNASTKS